MDSDIIILFLLLCGLVIPFFNFINVPLILILINLLALIPVFISAVNALKKRQITVDLLAVIALVVALVAGEWHSAIFINLMLTCARIFSRFTEKSTENSLKSLLKYKPASIRVKEGREFVIKKPEEIKIGDIIQVLQGERIAVDGKILNGESAVDESTLTGESFPRSVKAGDTIYSSTLNIDGNFEMIATKTENESTLANIILASERASLEKSKTVTLSNKFAGIYVSATLVLAIVVYIFTGKLDFVLSILLVVCADDLAVAIPLAYTLGISKATKMGILVKSSKVFEKLPLVKIIVTDKTGTITGGKIKVKELVNFSKLQNTKLFSILHTAVSGSKHPVSRSIYSYLKTKKPRLLKYSQYKEFPGDGVKLKIGSDNYFFGKLNFLKRMGMELTKGEEDVKNKYISYGYSSSYLTRGKKLVCMVIFRDEIKANIKNVINRTKELGVAKWIMLTGDEKIIAENIALEAGVDEYQFQLSPKDKLNYIKELNKDGKSVAMVGDGVNDAPALSISDVSIAMGMMGSDTAIEASDISIMNDNLEKIPEVMALSGKIKNAVTVNIIFWVITNSVGLLLVFGGIAGPKEASAYNFLTDIFTTLSVFWLLN